MESQEQEAGITGVYHISCKQWAIKRNLPGQGGYPHHQEVCHERTTLAPESIPHLLEEVAKITLEAIMRAEREAFLAEHRGIKTATTGGTWTPAWP